MELTLALDWTDLAWSSPPGAPGGVPAGCQSSLTEHFERFADYVSLLSSPSPAMGSYMALLWVSEVKNYGQICLSNSCPILLAIVMGRNARRTEHFSALLFDAMP